MLLINSELLVISDAVNGDKGWTANCLDVSTEEDHEDCSVDMMNDRYCSLSEQLNRY